MNNLISRSALLEAMRKESILHRQAFHIDTKALIQHEEEFSACMRVVCSAPTVDAEVVRHGRWDSFGVRRKDAKGRTRIEYMFNACTLCENPAHARTAYCPNCGAKMLEGVDVSQG